MYPTFECPKLILAMAAEAYNAPFPLLQNLNTLSTFLPRSYAHHIFLNTYSSEIPLLAALDLPCDEQEYNAAHELRLI